jgi:hypothetical protein
MRNMKEIFSRLYCCEWSKKKTFLFHFHTVQKVICYSRLKFTTTQHGSEKGIKVGGWKKWGKLDKERNREDFIAV